MKIIGGLIESLIVSGVAMVMDNQNPSKLLFAQVTGEIHVDGAQRVSRPTDDKSKSYRRIRRAAAGQSRESLRSAASQARHRAARHRRSPCRAPAEICR